MGVLVVALLGVTAPDGGADRLDDDDFATGRCHARSCYLLVYARVDWRVSQHPSTRSPSGSGSSGAARSRAAWRPWRLAMGRCSCARARPSVGPARARLPRLRRGRGDLRAAAPRRGHLHGRGDRRGPGREGRAVRRARRRARPRGGARQHHLVAVGQRAGRRQRARRPLRGAARLQPRHEDGADRARVPGCGERRDARPHARAVRRARQDRRRGARHAGLRRQPAAVPVPVRGGRAARAHRAGRRPRSTPA